MKRSVPVRSTLPVASAGLRPLLQMLVWAVAGLALIALAYQIPARHMVQVGLNDAAYVQGFNDPVNRWGVIDPTSQATTPLRWSREQSYLLFPQIGLPATATIRWRALRSQGESLPTVRVLLNGTQELGVFAATGDWETQSFAIDGGLLKANDIFLELRTEPAIEVDGELRGVQVDHATVATNGWPVLPYPAQLVYGAGAIVLATALTRRRSRQFAVALTITLAFLLLYRLQITSYPIRTLPPLLLAALGALFAVRAVPRLGDQARVRLLTLLGVSTLALWCGWMLLTAQGHVALSVPGVERDFPVFDTRSTALFCGAVETTACVLRADGFYQIGYPLLLWLVKLLTGANAFAAARLIAALSGTLLLLVTWLLGRALYPQPARHGAALLALLALGLSPFVVQYGLYVGTDMPFTALWTAGLAALLAPRVPGRRSVALAGLVCGLAFLIRHPGLVLLPVGWIALTVLAASGESLPQRLAQRVPWRCCGWFTLGWLVAVAPQVVVNLADTGVPFYSQQAKNIWLAVYGNTDFGGRWNDAANDVTLREIVLADPSRFFGNWSRNLQAFVGTGAEDTREFGQAISLRLLAFPANWLALIGLGIWLWRGDRRQRLLVVGSVVYVLAVSVGFVLPRFFLPLAPILALASVTPLVIAAHALAQRRRLRLSAAQWFLVCALLLIAVLARGPQIGARYVLEHQDPAAMPQAFRPGYARLPLAAALSDQSTVYYYVWSARPDAPGSSSRKRDRSAVVERNHVFQPQ
jgi:hypothetical protein